MKRALGLLLLAISLTGCAVRAGYYGDPYRHDYDRDHWRDHDGRWHDRDDRGR